MINLFVKIIVFDTKMRSFKNPMLHFEKSSPQRILPKKFKFRFLAIWSPFFLAIKKGLSRLSTIFFIYPRLRMPKKMVEGGSGTPKTGIFWYFCLRTSLKKTICEGKIHISQIFSLGRGAFRKEVWGFDTFNFYWARQFIFNFQVMPNLNKSTRTNKF